MAVQWMETKWIGAAWCCMPLFRSPLVTYCPQQAHVPVWGVSLVACPQPPVIPFPLGALYFLMDHTSVAQSVHWIQMQVEAQSIVQTATRQTRGAVIPIVTMTLLDQGGWRLRQERQRRGADLEALRVNRGRPSSAPRGGQCLIPHSAGLSHLSPYSRRRVRNLKRFWSQNTSFFNFLNSELLLKFYIHDAFGC